MNAYSLLIDIGGTDIKFALAEGDHLLSETIWRISAPPLVDNYQGTISSQPFIELIQKNIDKFLSSEYRVERILISGQMGSWILTDPEGHPLTELVSWQSRDSATSEILKSIFMEDFVSFSEPLSGSRREDWKGAPWRTVPSFISKMENQPTEILFHTLVSWTTWVLTNKSNHEIHLTDASATGMYSQTKEVWMGNFESFNTRVIFPLVTASIHPVGKLNGTRIPVYIGLADQQVSFFGAGLKRDSYIVNAGTGGQVARLVEGAGSDIQKIRPYFENSYIETITHLPSGRYLKRFLDKINVERGEALDWNWLFERGCEESSDASIMPIINWDYDEFLRHLNPEGTSAEIADEFVRQICQNFISSLQSLGFKSGDTVFLAGGVATKLKCLRKKLNFMSARTIKYEGEETTLEGLAKLTNLLETRRLKELD